MILSIVLRQGFFLSMFVVVCGCSLFNDNDGCFQNLDVTIAASESVVSPAEHVGLTVRVENLGSSRIVWGRGSSSCQLGAVVRVDETDRIATGNRVCTDDLVEQGLDSGESRSETWTWDGQILGDDGFELLPAGEYAVYGVAGLWHSRECVKIRVIQQ